MTEAKPSRAQGKVEVKVTGGGFIFSYGDREAGPFRYGSEVDEVEVAAQLSGLGPSDVEEWRREPGVNVDRWVVHPRDVFMARLRVGDYMPQYPPPWEYGEEGLAYTQVSRLDAELVGRRAALNAQVVSEQSQKALPRSLIISCTNCDEEVRRDLADPENRDLLEAVVFMQKETLRTRAQAAFIEAVGRGCSEKSGHRVKCEEEGFMDYAVLGVRDLLEEVERFDQQVYRSRRVHLVGVKVPPSKKVNLRGAVTVDPSSRDLCVLADGVRPLETQVAGFQVTDEDRAEWPKWFNAGLDIAAQIAPDMVGREIVQRAYLLLLHSVAEIPDIHGRLIRGCLRILCLGDTKTYKSESAKDLTIGHYGLGGFIVAESSSRTGITYTIDTENRAIVWGELPNNDLGLTVIDGLHALFSEEMKELRESLENQRVIVRRYVSGEALARTRVIGILNPEKPMNQYLYPCMAVKDNTAFYDPPDITRWDLFLTFAKEDVPPGEIARRRPRARPVPEEVFKRHVYWAWSRRPDQVQYTAEARELIEEASVELMEGYSLSVLPIVHLGVRDILCRLSVAQAALDHSTGETAITPATLEREEKVDFCTKNVNLPPGAAEDSRGSIPKPRGPEDETHTLVIVDGEHVEKALGFYREMLDLLGLGEYKVEMEGRLEISPSELEEIVKDLGPTEMDILNSIRIHSKSSKVLAEELDLSDVTIKRHYKPLRRHGLITTKPGVGITLTARGVQFLKSLRSRPSIIVSKNDTMTLSSSLGERCRSCFDIGIRLQREKEGEAVTSMEYYAAVEKELGLTDEEIQRVLKVLERDKRVSWVGPNRLKFWEA